MISFEIGMKICILLIKLGMRRKMKTSIPIEYTFNHFNINQRVSIFEKKNVYELHLCFLYILYNFISILEKRTVPGVIPHSCVRDTCLPSIDSYLILKPAQFLALLLWNLISTLLLDDVIVGGSRYPQYLLLDNRNFVRSKQK